MNHPDSCLVVDAERKPLQVADSGPIPWAAPLTQSMQAMKRAERLLVEGKLEEALVELRVSEENARFCRFVIEAKRS